jgi:hypothetical protein
MQVLIQIMPVQMISELTLEKATYGHTVNRSHISGARHGWE